MSWPFSCAGAWGVCRSQILLKNHVFIAIQMPYRSSMDERRWLSNTSIYTVWCICNCWFEEDNIAHTSCWYRSRVLTIGGRKGTKMLTAPEKSQLTIGHRPSPLKTGNVDVKPHHHHTLVDTQHSLRKLGTSRTSSNKPDCSAHL